MEEDDDDDDDDEGENQPWYTGGRDTDEDDKDPDFTLSRVWKEYKVFKLLSAFVPPADEVRRHI